MQEKRIGIIDSGVGGLSVYREINAKNLSLPVIYLADSLNIPYGAKSSDFITKRSIDLVRYLTQKEIETIVIACNTITVTCLDTLRDTFPDTTFIGTVPVIKLAVERSENKQIGVLSTTRTTQSQYLDDLIAQFANDCIVTSIGTDELVPLIESGEIDGEVVEHVLERILEPFSINHCDTLVLGCTHFPFLKPVIQRILGEHMQVFDSGEAIARQLERVLEKQTSNPSHIQEDIMSTTGDERLFSEVIGILLGGKISNEMYIEKVIV